MQSLVLIMNLACNDKADDTAIPEDTAVEAEETDTEESDTEETDTEETDTDETDTQEPAEEPDFTIDSSDSTIWVYFNLNDGAIVPSADDTTTDWDIKLQRYSVGLNGGVSGSGSVVVMVQEGTYDGYNDISSTPTGGTWITDEADADGDGKPEYALDGWFNYDFTNHTLSPKDIVYFIETPDGVFKFRVMDYYNESGESGFMSFDSELIE
jgi:hypothetical protein